MMHRACASLAICVLDRVVSNSDALAGDLLERFENGGSVTRLWIEVLAAVLVAHVDGSDEIRPLRLVDLQPADAVERSRQHTRQTSQVNLTGTPLRGAGGLTVIVFACLVTRLAPGVWLLLLASTALGAVLGALLIGLRRHRALADTTRVFDELIPRCAPSIAFALFVASIATNASAQTAASASNRVSGPSFDVTSVKPNAGGVRGGAMQPGRFVQSAVTVRQLVRMAYGTTEIVGGPAWADVEQFDVEGRGSFDLNGYVPDRAGAPPRVYVMLQQLLRDRFKLVVHSVSQERPVYALVTARSDRQPGPRLTRSTIDCDAQLAATLRGQGPAPPGPSSTPRCALGGGPGHIVADSITMSRLADALSAFTDRVVVDRTGLAGWFNLELQWTTELTAVASSNSTLPEMPPVLVTAIREQLGLKLEPSRAPIDVLVIDSVARPVAN